MRNKGKWKRVGCTITYAEIRYVASLYEPLSG